MVPHRIGNYVGYALCLDNGVLSVGKAGLNNSFGDTIIQFSSSSCKLLHDPALDIDFNNEPYGSFTISSEKGKLGSGSVVNNVIEDGFSIGHVGSSRRHEEDATSNIKDTVESTNSLMGLVSQFKSQNDQENEAQNASPLILPKVSSQETFISGEGKVNSVGVPHSSSAQLTGKDPDIYLTNNIKYMKNNLSSLPLMYHDVHQKDAPVATAATLNSSISPLYAVNETVFARKKRSLRKKIATTECKKVMKEQNAEKSSIGYEKMGSCTNEKRLMNEPICLDSVKNYQTGDAQIRQSSELARLQRFIHTGRNYFPVECKLNMKIKPASGSKRFADSSSRRYEVEHPKILKYGEKKKSWSAEKANLCHYNGIMSSKYSELDPCQVNMTQIEQQSKRNVYENISGNISEGNFLIDSKLSMKTGMDGECLESGKFGQIDEDMRKGEKLLGDRMHDCIGGEHIARNLAMSLDCQVDFVDFLKYIDSIAMPKGLDKPETKCVKAGNVNSSDHKLDKRSVNQKLGSQEPDKKNDDCGTRKRDGFDAFIYDESLKLSNKNKRKTSKRKCMGGGNPSAKKRKSTGKHGLIVHRMSKEIHQENSSPEKAINILSTLIKEGIINENELVCYKVKNTWDSKGLRGFVTREGIRCTCCGNVVSLTVFGAHAGSDSVKHWYNIFVLSSGKSLFNCLSEVWKKEKMDKNIQFQLVCIGEVDPSDDTCGVCADGGQLICCDSCPSTFHQECVMLKALPEGEWYCPFCICAFCSAYEHVKLEGCILHECRQCGRKYHKECAWEWNKPLWDLESKPFCGGNCMKIADKLSHKIGLTNPISDGFTWTLLKRVEEDENINSDERLSIFMECNVKLSLAFSVLNECFVPLIDTRTGLEMICQAVYNCGSNFKRLNYERFCTVMLEKNEEIISVALLRIHGTKLAEMPFIATRALYRQQGMCRRLLGAIEQMLSSLCVEKLIIAAIPDMVETWKNSFSFRPLEESHKEEIRSISIMFFVGTTLLQKPIFQHPS